MAKKTEKPVITIDDEKNVAILTIENGESTKEEKKAPEHPFLVSPRTGITIPIEEGAGKYGIDTLGNFVEWAAEMMQHIRESSEDGKYTFGEKVQTSIKFIGGIGNLSKNSLVKIAQEVEDLSEAEIEMISKQIRTKLIITENDGITRAIRFVKFILIAIQAIKNAVEEVTQ